MAHAKRVSKRKRRRIALPALGAAGVSLVMAGGAAATAPTTNVPSLQDTSLRPVIALDEEEIADVSLATFHIFGKENKSALGQGIRLAARGCGGRCGGGCAAARCGGCAGRRLRSGQVRRQVRRRLRSGQVRRLRRLGDRLRRLRGHRLRRRLLAVDVGWLGMGLLLTV